MSFTVEQTAKGNTYIVCDECATILLPMPGKLRGKERSTHVRVCPGHTTDNNEAA